MKEDLLGLPLQTALERLKKKNIQPRIVVIRAPRTDFPHKNGEPRVIRYRQNEMELTVAFFSDPVAERPHITEKSG